MSLLRSAAENFASGLRNSSLNFSLSEHFLPKIPNFAYENTPILREFSGKIEIAITNNLFYWKFAAVSEKKSVKCCPHLFLTHDAALAITRQASVQATISHIVVINWFVVAGIF